MKISELFAEQNELMQLSHQEVSEQEASKSKARVGGAFDDVRKAMSEKKKRKTNVSQETPAKGQKRIDTFFSSKSDELHSSSAPPPPIREAGEPGDLLPRTCEEWDEKWNGVMENFKVGREKVSRSCHEQNMEECEQQEPVMDLKASMENPKLEQSEESAFEAKEDPTISMKEEPMNVRPWCESLVKFSRCSLYSTFPLPALTSGTRIMSGCLFLLTTSRSGMGGRGGFV